MWSHQREKFKGLYLDCAKVHVLIVEVSALCQFRKVALGEGKSENITHIHSLVGTSSCAHDNPLCSANTGSERRRKTQK